MCRFRHCLCGVASVRCLASALISHPVQRTMSIVEGWDVTVPSSDAWPLEAGPASLVLGLSTVFAQGQANIEYGTISGGSGSWHWNRTTMTCARRATEEGDAR